MEFEKIPIVIDEVFEEVTGERVAEDKNYLCFRDNGQFYGIDQNCISEVIACPKMTEVPFSPAFVEGIINLKGRILPVIDVSKKFNPSANAQATLASKKIALIGQDEQGTGLALLIDSIIELNVVPVQREEDVGKEHMEGEKTKLTVKIKGELDPSRYEGDDARLEEQIFEITLINLDQWLQCGDK